MADRDDVMSSEELIRRARLGLDVESATPTDTTTPPAPDRPIVREPIRPDPFPGEDIGQASDPWREGEGGGSGAAVDDAPYQGNVPGYTTPAPHQPPRVPAGRILQRFGGWILVGVLALGGFAWRALSDTKPVEDLAVGDCINEPQEEIITDIKTVDCADLHDYEVYAVVQVPYTKDASYPGDENLFWESLDICVGYFAGFVGMDYADSVYDINAIYPTQESWDEQDDRETTCLIAQYNSVGDILRVTGTLRDVRR